MPDLDLDRFKRVLKMAKDPGKIAYAFFLMGQKPQDNDFIIDPKKKAKALFQAEKEDHKLPKGASFGTIQFDGKTVTLDAEKAMPGLQKQVQAWFKANKLVFKVELAADEDPKDAAKDKEKDKAKEKADEARADEATLKRLAGAMRNVVPQLKAMAEKLPRETKALEPPFKAVKDALTKKNADAAEKAWAQLEKGINDLAPKLKAAG